MCLEKLGFQSDITTHFLELASLGQQLFAHSNARIPTPITTSLLNRHIYPLLHPRQSCESGVFWAFRSWELRILVIYAHRCSIREIRNLGKLIT